MDPFLYQIKTTSIKKEDLIHLLGNSIDIDSWIAQRIEQEELIPLTEDFYVVAHRCKDAPDPLEQIANHLYEPSYVSLEWALAYYGMIPEGVYNVSSITTNETKSFKTSLCWFFYEFLEPYRFNIGITHIQNSIGGFLMATPEKALADLIHLRSNDLDVNELVVDLLEGRRIDESDLEKLNKNHLLEIEKQYQSQAVTNLVLAVDKIT